MKVIDLTPKMDFTTLQESLVFPESFEDQTGGLLGGLTAGSRELTHGKIKIQGVDERILFGDATAYDEGIGIYIGKDSEDDLYKFRAGDPEGTYIAWNGTGLSVVGFLEEGEAAGDVNANATTIDGGKITANTVTATQLIATEAIITAAAQIQNALITSAKIVSLDATKITSQLVNAQIATIEWAKITSVSIENGDISNLSADKINTGTLSGISIEIGSDNAVFKADSNGIYLGNATYSSAPFRVNMSGDVIAKSLTLSGTLSTDTGAYLRTSSGNDRLEFSNTDYLRFYRGGTERMRLRGSSADGGVGLIAEIGSFVTRYDEGFYACVDSSFEDFFKFYCHSSNGIIEAPNSNIVYLTDASGNTLTSWSTSQFYSAKKIYVGDGIEMNDTTIYEIKMANFSEHSSRPNDDDGIWYYKSGGSYGFRSRMEGGNWSFTQESI